ncbi:Holliday junction resolvase RuvX, partial [Streptomyces albidoflavus]
MSGVLRRGRRLAVDVGDARIGGGAGGPPRVPPTPVGN